MPIVIQNIITAAFSQIIGVFGIFFVFGFILYQIQKYTSSNYYRSIGWKGILWTAWLGTPIHELSHAFFAFIFRHRIEKIVLFKPNRETGELGHLNHSYNKLSLYQRMGSFFVGAGPLIIGPILLTTMLYTMVPNAKAVFNPLINTFSSISAFSISIIGIGKLFILENIRLYKFWVFIYISFCIASHMAPSRADLKTMWSGLAWIFGLLVAINIVAFMLEANITKYVLLLNQYLGIFTAIFVYATVLSIIHYIFSRFIFAIFSKGWKIGQ